MFRAPICPSSGVQYSDDDDDNNNNILTANG
jgi:hypothetical protein